MQPSQALTQGTIDCLVCQTVPVSSSLNLQRARTRTSATIYDGGGGAGNGPAGSPRLAGTGIMSLARSELPHTAEVPVSESQIDFVFFH